LEHKFFQQKIDSNYQSLFYFLLAVDYNSVTLKYVIEDLNGKKILVGETQNEKPIDIRKLSSSVNLLSVSGENKIVVKMKLTKL
jgi:hypothetical protein